MRTVDTTKNQMLNVNIVKVLNIMITIWENVQSVRQTNITGIDVKNFNGRINT